MKALYILLIITNLFYINVFAQVNTPSDSLHGVTDNYDSLTRYGIWVTPTGNKHITIDGIAIGLIAVPGANGQLRINGLNLEILPVAFVTLPGSVFGTFATLISGDYYAEAPEKIRTVIHGFSFSAGMFKGVEMHGVSLNFNSYSSSSMGFEASLCMNANYFFSGVQLSTIGNRAVKGKGLQVGLLNSCDECNVVQIGFLNRIGNRVLPLINFSLKKRKAEPEKRKKDK